jgi:hypothetical protein
VLLKTDNTNSILEETENLLEIKPGIFGVTLNVKVMITRFCIWWLRRFGRDK